MESKAGRPVSATPSDSDRLAAFDRWYQETTARAKAHPRVYYLPSMVLRELIGELPAVPCPCEWCAERRSLLANPSNWR